MSRVTSSSTALPAYPLNQTAAAVGATLSGIAGDSAHTFRSLQTRLNDHPFVDGSRKPYLILGVVAILLHGAVVWAYIHRDKTPSIRLQKHQVEIEFIKPAVVPPPQQIEPPKPPPPPPPKVVRQVTPPPRAPQPALRTAPAEDHIAQNDLTVPENTEEPKSTAPVVAAAPEPPPPPPPKVEEPVTEATGYASYLKNPPPEYPAFAQRQGWEGTVLLRVHVLASGKPDKVDVKQSSGRKTLDDAAVSAVRNWTFAPSKRGNTAIDGWATVPIEFKLAK